MKLLFTLSDGAPSKPGISLPVDNIPWIVPWKTGLPDVDGMYLITNSKGDVGVSYYVADNKTGGLIQMEWKVYFRM